MGVYIEGMEMPKRGMVVNIYADGRVTNHFDEFGKTIGKAVSVPKGRLIDAEALIDEIARMAPLCITDPTANSFLDGLSATYEAIKTAPTIILAEEE